MSLSKAFFLALCVFNLSAGIAHSDNVTATIPANVPTNLTVAEPVKRYELHFTFERNSLISWRDEVHFPVQVGEEFTARFEKKNISKYEVKGKLRREKDGTFKLDHRFTYFASPKPETLPESFATGSSQLELNQRTKSWPAEPNQIGFTVFLLELKPEAGEIIWGSEVNGLQLGIRPVTKSPKQVKGSKSPFTIGDIASFDVELRNNGKTPVFIHTTPSTTSGPIIIDHKGWLHAYEGAYKMDERFFFLRTGISLNAGQAIIFQKFSLRLGRYTDKNQLDAKIEPPFGEVQVGYEYPFELSSSQQVPSTILLSTGKTSFDYVKER